MADRDRKLSSSIAQGWMHIPSWNAFPTTTVLFLAHMGDFACFTRQQAPPPSSFIMYSCSSHGELVIHYSRTSCLFSTKSCTISSVSLVAPMFLLWDCSCLYVCQCFSITQYPEIKVFLCSYLCVLSQIKWCFSSQEVAWVMNEWMFE